MFLPSRQKNRIHFIYGGFTLVELLVVISIIAVLSSIVLVSLQDARDKARISAGIQHNSSIYQLHGNDLLGWWKFDEIKSISGVYYTKNEATDLDNVVTGALPQNKPTPPVGIDGRSFYFSNQTGFIQYLDISPSIALSTLSGFTFSAWIKNGSDVGTHELINYWRFVDGTMRYYIGGYYNTDAGAIPSDKWIFVVMTYDNTTKILNYYVDGKLVKTHTVLGSLSSSINIVSRIGRNSSGVGDYRFNGYVDDLRVYSKALGVAQIQKIYAEGAVEHNLALNKNVP